MPQNGRTLVAKTADSSLRLTWLHDEVDAQEFENPSFEVAGHCHYIEGNGVVGFAAVLNGGLLERSVRRHWKLCTGRPSTSASTSLGSEWLPSEAEG